MLKVIRVILAVICLLAVTFLFLDFTGIGARYLGWLAKWQFIPALLSTAVVPLAVLIILPFIFGRVYCSVLCPLGVLQDVISWVHCKLSRRHKFGYCRPLTLLRCVVLLLFVVALMLGLSRLAAFIEPYSEYGRIVSSVLRPAYIEVNNIIAANEAPDSYTFYNVDYYETLSMVVVGVVTLLVVGGLAWWNGRIYCNTICPVGTILGYMSQFSLLKPVIDSSKCVKCGKCARECKASCIDAKNERIDYTRCVACMDCIGNCSTGAISYIHPSKKKDRKSEGDSTANDKGRRDFLTVSALLAATAAVKAQEKTVDGGLAEIIDKKKPVRRTRITPPGSKSHDNFYKHCTSCQLCVSKCSEGVLRPSVEAGTFMQPEMSYERGYCRPECTDCSQVCPVGAILPLDAAEKSAVQVGHAVWIRENCLPAVDGTSCGNCARHCPVGAITMIALKPEDPASPKVPSVNTERCIGCGACENLCPVRPFSAIYVEGHEIHRMV